MAKQYINPFPSEGNSVYDNQSVSFAERLMITMKTWRPSLCAAWTVLLDTVYVVDERTKEMLILQEDAVPLWQCIERGMSTKEIMMQLARPEHLEEDHAAIVETLENLRDQGLIEEVE